MDDLRIVQRFGHRAIGGTGNAMTRKCVRHLSVVSVRDTPRRRSSDLPNGRGGPEYLGQSAGCGDTLG